MKFLIDECLSLTLATVARTRGFPQSTHVTWIGLRSHQDWTIIRRAINDGYVLVTHNMADFTSLMEREPDHPGLICMNVAHGLMSLSVQRTLFKYASEQIVENSLAGQVLEVKLVADRMIRVDLINLHACLKVTLRTVAAGHRSQYAPALGLGLGFD